MSGLEQAIRNALARAESSNPETRARIYQSARNALEAGLRKQEINDPEAIAAQRHRLEMTIRQVEAEQRAALQAGLQASRPAAPPATPEAVPEPPRPANDARPDDGDPHAAGSGPDQFRQAGSPMTEPQLRGETRDTPGAPRAPDRNGPTLDEIRPERGDRFGSTAGGARPESRKRTPETAANGVNAATGDRAEAARERGEADAIVAASPRMAKAPKRRGRVFSFLLVVATLAAVIGTAVWWVQSSGLLVPLSERDGSVANPPRSVNDEDFPAGEPGASALDTHNSFSSDWREVFAPADTAALSAGARARFEPISTDEGPAVRLVSSSADRDGAVSIAVAPEVLRDMAGKTSTIALTVEADDGKPVQVSVECDFGTLGNCDRHRFAVTDRTDLLFRVSFEGSLAPSAPGRLMINSDVSGGGAGVNLVAVRVLPGE